MQRSVRRLVRNAVRHRSVGLTLGAVNQPYWTARCYGGTDKTEHGYLPLYARYLGSMRMSRNVVVEIGVGNYESSVPSGSLKLWRDYFPRSVVAGVDIYPKVVQLGPRVRFFQADQSSPEDLAGVVAALGGQLDVVIDDGSHVGEHQWASFQALFPSISAGGWYVVEDLATSYWPNWGGMIPADSTTAVGLLGALVSDAQVGDPIYGKHPEWGQRPDVLVHPGVAEVHVHPGIAFIRKAALD
ncbi:MAG: class I SAM-dependent methyltransferase [Rhodococcus sp.]|nr:class I SAM-dependent methyltransferase [Rhodococcus sp. (in: high G+C Gram-positive bacteria)]